MAPKVNPLNALVAPAPASFPRDFRFRPMPKLSDAIKAGGSLPQIFAAHDAAMEAWGQDAERSVNERITQQLNTPLGTKTTAASTATATTPTTPTAPAAPAVDSVNGKTGTVVLTTDDIADSVSNPYLTPAGWLALFDHSGFARSSVPFSDMVHVPAGRNTVLAGPFTVDGLLVIDGYVLFL